VASPHPVAGCRVDRDHLPGIGRAQVIFVLVCSPAWLIGSSCVKL